VVLAAATVALQVGEQAQRHQRIVEHGGRDLPSGDLILVAAQLGQHTFGLAQHREFGAAEVGNVTAQLGKGFAQHAALKGLGKTRWVKELRQGTIHP